MANIRKVCSDPFTVFHWSTMAILVSIKYHDIGLTFRKCNIADHVEATNYNIGKKISIVDDIREGFQKKRLFLMTFAIKRRTPLPLNGTFFHPFFYPTFFLLQLNLTYMKWILNLVSVKKITLSPLIIGSKLTLSRWTNRWLPYSALFRVTSTTIYT